MNQSKIKPTEQKWLLETKTIYELTICPDDDRQYSGHINRHLKTHKVFKEILAGYDHILYAEIEMPQYGDKYKNTMARIHFHGMIAFQYDKDILEWLLVTHQQLTKVSRIQFNKFRDIHWTSYIRKNYELFKKLKINLKNMDHKDFINKYKIIIHPDFPPNEVSEATSP